MSKLICDAQSNITLVTNLSNECWPNNPLLASLTTVQAILEGGLRNNTPSELALKYCNLFGMKPGFIRNGTASPGTISLPTHEYVQGTGMIEINQPFLSNNNIEDSLNQHKQLLSELDRYSNLFECTTFEDIAHAISSDGYATDPKYADELIEIYQNYIGDK